MERKAERVVVEVKAAEARVARAKAVVQRAAASHKREIRKLAPGELLHRAASYIIILEGVLHTFYAAPRLALVGAGAAFVVYEVVLIITTGGEEG